MAAGSRLGSIYVAIRALTGDFTKDLTKARGKAQAGGKEIQGSLDKLNTKKAVSQVKKLATAFIALGGTMAAKRLMEFGANFDRSMRIVQVVSGATSKEFDKLVAKAKEMGETTEFTAKQSADALKYLSMAGLTATQSLKALPQMLDLATAGQIELALAADISTNILTQMGLEVKELTRVSDALVAVQASANTNIQEAAQAFIYAGTRAKTFGVSVEELVGLIGLLANSGIKASLAGTTLSQSMIKLLTASGKAKDILEKYNIQITDNDGNLRKYLDILGDLSDAHLTASEVAQMFGARASNIQIILDKGRVKIIEYIDSVKASSGAAAEAAETIRSDFKGAFDELVSAIQGVMLNIWDLIRGPMTFLIKKIKNLVSFPSLLGQALGMASAGIISFTDIAKANVEELVALVEKGKRLMAGPYFRGKIEYPKTKEDPPPDMPAPVPYEMSIDELLKQEQLKNEIIWQAHQQFLDQKQAARLSELNLETEFGELSIATNQSMLDRKVTAEEIAAAKITEINRKQEQARRKMWSDSLSAASNFFASLYSLTGSTSKKLFAVSKVAAIAEALINTYQAFTKTLASVSYPYNIAAAASVLAAGMAKVAAIRSTSFGGGGAGGGAATPVYPASPLTGFPETTEDKKAVEFHFHGDFFGDEAFLERLAELLSGIVGTKDVTLLASHALVADEVI